jgi:hypothetical protein
VNALLWQAGSIGIYPLAWPRPDGQPIDNDSWSAPGRLMASMNVHFTVSSGWWPTKGVHFVEGKDWLPKVRVKFEDLVDHLSRELLHTRASGRLVKACCQATGLRPHEVIDPEHELVQWGMGRLLTTFLDSPEFMSR